MGAAGISHLMSLGLIFWLTALALLVFYKLLTRPQSFSGMLCAGGDSSRTAIDIERLQLLIVFLIGVAFYIKAGAGALSEAATITTMPETPGLLTEFLLASNTIYLAGKFSRKLQKGDTP